MVSVVTLAMASSGVARRVEQVSCRSSRVIALEGEGVGIAHIPMAKFGIVRTHSLDFSHLLLSPRASTGPKRAPKLAPTPLSLLITGSIPRLVALVALRSALGACSFAPGWPTACPIARRHALPMGLWLEGYGWGRAWAFCCSSYQRSFRRRS